MVEEVVEGDSASEVLSYLQYDVAGLEKRIEISCREAVDAGSLTGREAEEIVSFYRSELEGYTYLEPEDSSG
jgi:arginine decarboxylase